VLYPECCHQLHVFLEHVIVPCCYSGCIIAMNLAGPAGKRVPYAACPAAFPYRAFHLMQSSRLPLARCGSAQTRFLTGSNTYAPLIRCWS